MRPGLTLNYGLRWDMQRPPVNLNGVYTRPGYEGVWGISGVGNLFSPGTITGKAISKSISLGLEPKGPKLGAI